MQILERKNFDRRIEHSQVLDAGDFPTLSHELGVIASMQPNHLLTDMNWAQDRLGTDACAVFLCLG